MSDLIVGKEINGYRVQEVLGRGGMGVVYKAEEIALSRPVALKCLNPQLADDESFLSRFRSEARAIARVNSPYIVQIYTFSETEIGLVIVMEYVEGRTLKQRITAGETGWKESLPLIQQMLTALRHAHGAGVIHRDVKPQNILLSDIVLAHGVRVKMTDFGLAKVNTTGDPSRTVTQGVYGTLHYMSPEQVEGHGEIDHRGDIYSLGMTCYEMLAGRLPFGEDSSEYTIMRTIVEEDLPELGTFAPEVPDELRDIVMTAVAKDPAERFQSAAEMQDALSALEESSEQGDLKQEPAPLPAGLDPPEENPLAPGTPGKESVDPPAEVVESPTESADWISFSLSSMIWRVTGAGAVLAAVLALGWYFAIGSSAPSAEPKQEATASVEREALEGNPTPTGNSSAGAPEEEPTGGASTEEQDSGAEPSDRNASDGQSGQSEGDQTTGDEAGEQTASTAAPGEKASGAGATDPEATDQETADPDEARDENRRDLPPSIAALLDIDDPSVLDERIDERVAEGQLVRGDGPEDFFTPDQCYIFVVDPGAGRVEAVLSPKTNGARIELRSGKKVDEWTSRYDDGFHVWTAPTSD